MPGGDTGVPRGPGGVYRTLAMELKGAAWRAQLRGRAKVEVIEVPSLKEVHIVVGATVFSFKIAERRWWTSPRLLLKYARNLLRHGKERGRSVHPILLLPRLTGGALRLAATRLRWIRVVPYRSIPPRALVLWVLWKLQEALQEAIRWRREKGLPARWLWVLERETRRTIDRLRGKAGP